MINFLGKLRHLKRIIIVWYAKRKHPYDDERIRKIHRIMRRHRTKMKASQSDFSIVANALGKSVFDLSGAFRQLAEAINKFKERNSIMSVNYIIDINELHEHIDEKLKELIYKHPEMQDSIIEFKFQNNSSSIKIMDSSGEYKMHKVHESPIIKKTHAFNPSKLNERNSHGNRS